MSKLGDLPLDRDQPRIVATVAGTTSMSVLAALPKEGADIIETRLDHFQNLEPTTLRARLTEIRHVGLPMIATVRSQKERGAAPLSDDQRLRAYETALELVDAADVELSSEKLYPHVVSLAHAAGKLAILSLHNFDKTPTRDALDTAVEAMLAAGADVCKVATYIRERSDVLRLLDFLVAHAANTNMVVVGMGPLGKITRVLFPLFGSLWTYGFVDRPFAPGQLQVQQLREQLRLFTT